MIGPLRLAFASVALASAQPGLAQVASVVLPRILDDGRCAAPSDPGGEIVVCGSRGNDRYRIPETLRDGGPIDARNESPVAARREAGSLDRFGAQTVGPGGYLQHSRQVDCEWRAARQTLQGRQPDCTLRINPDDAADWQRR